MSMTFTGLPIRHGIAIGMDRKSAWRENQVLRISFGIIGRLWRTIEYDELYLRAYASVSEARASRGRSIDGFYNVHDPHSSLGRLTSSEAYVNALPSIPMAA